MHILQFNAPLSRCLAGLCTFKTLHLKCFAMPGISNYLDGVTDSEIVQVERDGIPRKTAQFEAAWRERRCKWLDSVQNGTSIEVIELNTSPSADIWSGAGTKRVCFSSQYPSCFQCQVIFTYGVTSRAIPTQISLTISRPLMHPLPLLSND
jgi:hypothetical protein